MLTQAEIRICNEQVRPLADAIIGTFSRIQQFLLLWQALKLDDKFPADGTDLVEDGSPNDGRNPITTGDVRALKDLIEGLAMTAIDPTNERFPKILRIAVNPR